MTVIYYHRAETYDGKGIIRRQDLFKVETFNTIAQNNEFLCIDDRRFTTIRLKPDKDDRLDCVLERPGVSLHMHDSCFGNGVSLTLYATEQWSARAIRGAILTHVKKRLGFFLDGLDLSFIKDIGR